VRRWMAVLVRRESSGHQERRSRTNPTGRSWGRTLGGQSFFGTVIHLVVNRADVNDSASFEFQTLTPAE
jgi:hypothetical protein